MCVFATGDFASRCRAGLFFLFISHIHARKIIIEVKVGYIRVGEHEKVGSVFKHNCKAYVKKDAGTARRGTRCPLGERRLLPPLERTCVMDYGID